MKKIFVILLAVIFWGCSPKVITKSIVQTTNDRSHLYYEPFVLIEVDTIDRSAWQPIGQIEIKDGFSVKCGYEIIKKIAKKEALKLGGNCLVITRHREPDGWSMCHRIKADVFIIDSPEKYEKEIIWNKKRRLVISDFKGTIEKRPFTAATVSSFRYKVRRPLSAKYKLMVETYFDCHSSYFKHSDFNAEVLAHEQIHFDITELYTRKFIQQMESEAKNIHQFNDKVPQIVDKIWRELQLKQDEYDSEVYADSTQQEKWAQWIKQELKNLEQYEDKVLIVKKEK